jgi:hypothetical protein
MVAYTSPDCLPYYECTDSPCLNTGTVCEPSNVFCDLTALVEDILNTFDSSLGRTATAVPFAKVARTAEQVESVLAGNLVRAFQVQWDTVLMDNADMVNLDSDNLYVKINRPGIWWVELYMIGIPDLTNNNDFTSYLIQRGPEVNFIPGTVLANSTSRWRASTLVPNPNTVQNRIAYSFQVTDADLSTNGTIDLGGDFKASGVATATGELTLTYAEMTVYWTAESTA